MRRYGFYHRCDTPTELDLLNQLWVLVNDRLNYLSPTKKPVDYTTDHTGKRKRVYDPPRSPYQRLLDAGVLNPSQQAELAKHKASLQPAAMAEQIHQIQLELTRLAALKTARQDPTIQPPLPHPNGIKRHAS